MSEKGNRSPNALTTQDTITEFMLYTAPSGRVKVEVILNNETIWLTQRRIADLFGVDRTVVTKHLRNIFMSGELDEQVVCAIFAHTTSHGAIPDKIQTRPVKYYNLDAVLSVGYRVDSAQATQFRVWATQLLKEYIIKGFAMNDQRLKNPPTADSRVPDYFDEWLERIRDIRSSEKRFYQKVRDIYATAIDYDKSSEQAKLFFQKVQNKMIWAITGRTAAELIVERSDSEKPNMGLTTWHGSMVRKSDVKISKNYLQENEITELNRIVTMYLDYAELQAKQRKTITMRQWADKLDAFLQFNEQELLTHAGKVQAAVAEKLVAERYEAFDAGRRRAAAIAADAEDIKEIETLEKKISRSSKRRNRNVYMDERKGLEKWLMCQKKNSIRKPAKRVRSVLQSGRGVGGGAGADGNAAEGDGGMSEKGNGEFILYQTEDGRSKVNLRAFEGTVWLLQLEMAALFDTTKQNISLHLKNLFKAHKLDEHVVAKKHWATAGDGKRYMIKHYNLEAILAVASHVRSPRCAQFRRWADEVLKEYLAKGFAKDIKAPEKKGGGVG